MKRIAGLIVTLRTDAGVNWERLFGPESVAGVDDVAAGDKAQARGGLSAGHLVDHGGVFHLLQAHDFRNPPRDFGGAGKPVLDGAF